MTVALLLPMTALAGTYKTEAECLSNLEAARAHRGGQNPLSDRMLQQAGFTGSKKGVKFCPIRYVDVSSHSSWPEGDAYSESVKVRLAESTKLQLQKALPDFPVFLADETKPPSFDKWIETETKEMGVVALGRSFLCYSSIAGEAKGGGIKTAVRAFHLKCQILGWDAEIVWEYETLGLVTDDEFESQYQQYMERVVDAFAKAYNLVMRR